MGSSYFLSSKKNGRTIGINSQQKHIFVSDGISNLFITVKQNELELILKRTSQTTGYELHMIMQNKRLMVKEATRFSILSRNKLAATECKFSMKENYIHVGKLSQQINEIVRASSTVLQQDLENYLDASCTSVENLFEVKSALTSNLSLSESPILKCLSSVDKESKLLEVAGSRELLGLAGNIVSDINLEKFPKISCSENISSKDQLASYSNNSMKLYTENGSVKEDRCNPVAMSIAHEYLHHLKSSGNSELDESIVKQIEEICWTDLGGIPEAKISCIQKDADKAEKDADVVFASADHSESIAADKMRLPAERANASASLQSAQVEQLQATINKETPINLAGVQITDSGWNSIAQAKPGTVPPAARQVVQAANSSFSSLSKIADQAFAMLSSEAQAAAPSKLSSSNLPAAQVVDSRGSISSRSKGLSIKPKDGDFKTVEEYLVGDSSAKSVADRPSQASSRASLSVAPAASNQTARAKAGSPPASDPRAAGNSALTEIASSSSPGSGGLASNVPQNFKPQSRSAGSSAPTQSGSRQPASSATGVQLLSAKTEVSGQDYRLIRRLYNDQSFKADLINLRIHIKTRAATLGVDPSRATHIFEDDGTKLKKIGGQ